MVGGSLCKSMLKPDLIYAISLEYSQKTLQCQISVVMSTIGVCQPRSWQKFSKRFAWVQTLSLRIQWENVMGVCVLSSGGKQHKILTVTIKKIDTFYLLLLVKIIKICQLGLIFFFTWKPGKLSVVRLIFWAASLLHASVLSGPSVQTMYTSLHLPSSLSLFSVWLTHMHPSSSI